jgi:hypothetical protein
VSAGSPRPFTWRYYAACLDAAQAAGYRFVSFGDTEDSDNLPVPPFILLRHDIDYEPDYVIPLAEQEVQRNIAATYFFQTDSRFYRLESPRVTAVVRHILACGHRLGLHFDASGIPDDGEVVRRVEEVAQRLEARFERAVEAVSFHTPTYRAVGHLRLARGRINAYGPVFFGPVEYVSDSNQDFRGKDVLDLLRNARARRLQLLIHPFWWRREYSAMEHKLEEMARHRGLALGDVLTTEQRAAITASFETSVRQESGD